MNKKLLLIVPATLLVLASCGKSQDPSGSEQKSSESPVSESSAPTSSGKSIIPDKKPHPWIDEDHAVSIQWDNTFSYTDAIATLIADFAELEPNVTIVNNKISGDYSAIEKQEIMGIPTLEYSSLVTCYPDHVADYLDYGIAVDFEDYMFGEYGFTDEEYEDIVAEYLKEGQTFYDDGTFVMPQSKSIEPMYYNNKILGVTIPGVNDSKPITEAYINSLTWEELFDVFCPAVKAYNDAADAKDKIYDATDAKSCIVGYDSDDNFFISLAKQYGYGYTSIDEASGNGKIDFNNDGMKALMKKLNGYYKAGYLQTQGTNGTYTSNLATTNKCLISIGSSAGAKNQFSSTLKFDVGVSPLPYAKDGRRAVISQGPSMAFFDHNDENRAKAAWLFYRFFSTTEYNTRWAIASNYLPIRYSVYEDTRYSAFAVVADKAPNTAEMCKARTGVAAKATAPYLYTSPVFKGSSEARTQVKALLTECLTTDDIDGSIDSIFKKAYDNTLLKI